MNSSPSCNINLIYFLLSFKHDALEGLFSQQFQMLAALADEVFDHGEVAATHGSGLRAMRSSVWTRATTIREREAARPNQF